MWYCWRFREHGRYQSIKDLVQAMAGLPFSTFQRFLFEPVLDLFAELQKFRTESRLMVVNHNDQLLIPSFIKKHGMDTEAVELVSCDQREVSEKMWEMDVGLFFFCPDPSRVSSIPARLGAFLIWGVPYVGNAGKGGVEGLLEGEGVGIVVRNFNSESVREAAALVVKIATDDECRTRCVESAKRHFSLGAGVATCEKVYRGLGGGSM